jgi:hypothetical protein
VVVNSVLGAMTAVVTAGTGVYLALRENSSPNASAGVVPVATASESVDGTTYDRTLRR